jgi:hypothetical protein
MNPSQNPQNPMVAYSIWSQPAKKKTPFSSLYWYELIWSCGSVGDGFNFSYRRIVAQIIAAQIPHICSKSETGFGGEIQTTIKISPGTTTQGVERRFIHVYRILKPENWAPKRDTRTEDCDYILFSLDQPFLST